VYTTPPNTSREAVEFAGVIRANVWLYSTATSADCYCRLTLVDPINGESISLCDGIQRITLNADVNGSTIADEDAWPKRFEVSLGNFCGSIEPRWRVRLMLAGGSFPQFSRNLGYGEDIKTAVTSTKAKHRVSFKEFDEFSELILPIIGGRTEAQRAFSYVKV
jgi:uncharacterized protein